MPQCVAYDCNNKSGRGAKCTFHRFPKDETLCREWVQALRRKNFTATPGVTLICSDHFLEVDFDRSGQTTRLKQGVIPSVFKFPPCLQKKLKERKPATDRHESSQPASTVASESPINPCGADHNYCLDPNPRKVKQKLDTAGETIKSLRKKLKVSHQKTRRLRKKVESLTTILKELKNKGKVSDNSTQIPATTFL
ncbi:small ribosomal subunit protein eS32 isoform X1 [Hippocampus comes]|uniref:small ribosomal subunit protein eS32 isoform X1 n=1 Tax=Hippocampus comes TaxID=109280 RepID=UPI00094EB0CD|nr:PREDICTED: THAP domain-containing protein 2-like isoform X1 [Hippocampus comes]